MSQPIETEIVQEMPSNAIALRPSMAVGQAMGVNEIVAQVKLIQEVMHKVMTDGEHYGTIPGCGNKKTLLQPGAQKLTMTFRLAPEYEIQEVNLERGHKEYRIICTLKSMGNGSFVGQGVGCCSSMESKYRWRGGARKCPECGKETIIKGKAEYGGGWLCWTNKGGCGRKWQDGASEIEGQSIEKVENDNPADTFNTVLKMAKKRAFVDATITATAASDIFTQDIGDDEESPPQKAAPVAANAPTTRQNTTVQTQTPQNAPKTDPVPLKEATKEQRQKMIDGLLAGGSDYAQMAIQYFIEIAAIMPNETLEDVPLRFVPSMVSHNRELGSLITKLSMEGKADKPSWLDQVSTEPAREEKPKPKGSGNPSVTGTVELVTLKKGTSKQGPWTLYGIKINGEWHNTFNHKIGNAAKEATGSEVTVFYQKTEKGKTATDLFIGGKSVLEDKPATEKQPEEDTVPF